MSTLRREQLLEQLRAAVTGCRPIVVTGESGIGKTTLLRKAVASGRRAAFEGGALASLSWIEHLCLRRALNRDLVAGDPAAVAMDVAPTVGAGVLLAEDLQWAQPSTLDVLALLVGRIAVLASVRTGSMEADTALAALQTAGFLEVPVPPLDEKAARDLVRATRTGLSPVDEDTVLRRSGGNPLILAELAAQPDPPASLRLALGARLRTLAAEDRTAFALVALAGRSLPRAMLDPDCVRVLTRAGLLVAAGQNVAVRHSLIGEIAIDLLGAEERATAHAWLARTIGDRGESARHHQLAGEPELARAAALEAAASTASPAETARHLQLAASLSSGPSANDLRLRAAQALESNHDLPAALAVLVDLRDGDPEVMARAALLRSRIAWSAGQPDQVRTAVADGLSLVAGTDTELEVRLRVEESRIHSFVDSVPEAAVASATAAWELAQRTGFALDRAEYLLGTALVVADRPGGPEHLLRAIDLARGSGDTETELSAASNLISFHESAGSPASARKIAEQMYARSGELGLVSWQAGFLMTVTQLDFHAGELEASIEAVERVLALPIDVRTRDYAREVMAMDLVDLGRANEAERLLSMWQAEAIADYKGSGQFLWVAAEAALWGGHPRRALRLLDSYLAGPEGDPNRVLGLVTRAWATVEAGLDPAPAVGAQVRPMLLAAVPESAALTMQPAEPETAAGLFAEAAELWKPYHRRGELRCRWAQGEALRRAGQREAAITVLRSVEQRAEELGHLMVLGRLRRALRAAGERRTAGRTSAASGLTGREHEVLTLIGQGLTNAQIATRLGITRRTVVGLVDSAAQKLGAVSRAQAASMALRD